MQKGTCAIVAAFCLCAVSVHAQIQFNPQIGINFARLTENPRIIGGLVVETEGKGGILAGGDLRFGDRVYLQPGLFLMGSKTIYSYGDSLLFNPAEIRRFDGKLKGMVGVKILDNGFTLRAMAGPTYNFNLDTNADNHPLVDEDEFDKGYFNIDAGIGIDVLFLTAEVGFSYALTDVLSEEIFENNPKYQSIYVTVGVVFGD